MVTAVCLCAAAVDSVREKTKGGGVLETDRTARDKRAEVAGGCGLWVSGLPRFATGGEEKGKDTDLI